MKHFFSNYIQNYKKIIIISDAKSEYISDIIFNKIKLILETRKNEKNILIILDDWNDINIRKQMNKITLEHDDYFLYRGIYKNIIGNSIFGNISMKNYQISDIIIKIIDNKISIIKDKYGKDIYVDVDVKSLFIGFKLKKIMNKIKQNNE